MKENIGYKLFRVMKSQPGKLFPLYVNADIETPVGQWINAECGPITKSCKVKSKLGELCFRPGWHLSDLPIATHIGIKENGVVKYIKPDHVWCEVEYSDEINYQNEANKNGINLKGVLINKNAFIKHIPVNGYYRYKTSPIMFNDWIIAGAIKINKILTDEEVNNILLRNDIDPMERYGGVFNYDKYGLTHIKAA